MSTATVNVIKTLWNTALSLLNSFYIPGFTRLTPLAAIIGSTVLILSIKFLKNLGGSHDV